MFQDKYNEYMLNLVKYLYATFLFTNIINVAASFNVWSCPHCYEGGMAAEVSDLSCDS